MQPRNKWVHFVMSQDELDRMQQKMQEVGIQNKSAYLRKMALDGYCVNLELEDVKKMSRCCAIAATISISTQNAPTRPTPFMQMIFRICRTGWRKSGCLRKKFWQDWRRFAKRIYYYKNDILDKRK